MTIIKKSLRISGVISPPYLATASPSVVIHLLNQNLRADKAWEPAFYWGPKTTLNTLSWENTTAPRPGTAQFVATFFPLGAWLAPSPRPIISKC